MRRVKPLSVKVVAPSRGVVTRWPAVSGDMLATGVDKFSLPGMKNRASAVGSNVRYEDGVVKRAPGYVLVQTPSNIVARWPMDECGGTRADVSGNHLDLTESIVPTGPTSLFISDYTPGSLVNPGAGTDTPEWDGKFKWFATNDLGALQQYVYYGTHDSFSAVISAGTVCMVVIQYDSDAGGWRLGIGNNSFTSLDILWSGLKLGNTTDPTGVYTNIGGSNPNPTTPASYTVVSITDTLTQLGGFQFCAS